MFEVVGIITVTILAVLALNALWILFLRYAGPADWIMDRDKRKAKREGKRYRGNISRETVWILAVAAGPIGVAMETYDTVQNRRRKRRQAQIEANYGE